MNPGADQYPSALDRLRRDECLRLLASVQVGRIVYTRQALPAVELVNFTLDGGDIVIRTDQGGKLAAATQGTVVAFEADDVDVAHHRGWSVTAVGYSREVTDPDDIARLRRTGPRPWAPGEREHFIRITPGIVNGRRLGLRTVPMDVSAPSQASLATRGQAPRSVQNRLTSPERTVMSPYAGPPHWSP